MEQKKKKTSIIILLAISILLNLVFLAFAFVQKAAADSARIEAYENEIKYLETEQFAKEQQSLASQNAMFADEAQHQAEQARKACESKLNKK